MSIPPIYEKARRFVYWWWIVPRVQYDFEDLDYQLYTFEIFHQDWRAKLAHYVTIPAITFFSLAFLAQFHLVGAPLASAAAVYVALLGIVHLRWCRRTRQLRLWAVTMATLVALAVAATAWFQARAIPDAPWYAPTSLAANPLLWIYVFGLIETLSHMFEPVPPHATGCDRFMEMDEFWRDGGRWRIAGVLGLPTLYTLTSLVSNIHLLPTLVLHMLASAGLERAYVREIVELAEAQWISRQPIIDQVPDRRARTRERRGLAADLLPRLHNQDTAPSQP
ncbi:MAG TPA: hypothetical protein VK034_15725 [Enhygromyxa sp.]|nr:hypothetical protein [Enhygromyxa sp.]